MKVLIRIGALMLLAALSNLALAKAGNPGHSCGNQQSVLCNMAYFAPYSNAGLAEEFKDKVQASLDQYAEQNDDIIKAPDCDWVGLNEDYLVCKFSTYKGAKCTLKGFVNRAGIQTPIECKTKAT